MEEENLSSPVSSQLTTPPSPPEHIDDDDLLIAYSNMKSHETGVSHLQYLPSIGLLLKLMKGTKRLWKRGKIPLPVDEGVQYLFEFWQYYAVSSYDHSYWTPDKLYYTAVEVNKICREISPAILRDLDSHPLEPPQSSGQFVHFERNFLLKVVDYHKSLERPPETFSSDKILIEDSSKLPDYLSLIEQLSNLPREICPKCTGRRQIYCGDCEGIRMTEAAKLLPTRISLPIDIVLLLHWRESLHKCTGIHAAVLSKEGTVQCIHWPKEDHVEDHPGWNDIIRNFDSNRDVLLYPYEDAMTADLFNWNEIPAPTNHETSQDHHTIMIKKRLIVLEGSWEGAKTMAHRITTIRRQLFLPPLPAVTLPRNITSHYWRLQHMGSGAVSTIEAIAHVISLISMTSDESNGEEHEMKRVRREDDCGGVDVAAVGDEVNEEERMTIGSSTDILLLLFNLQRHRMLSNVKKGAKVPMAIAASNNSGFTTSWAGIIANMMTGEEEENR